MKAKLFQITIKERKNDGTERKHFYVIKTDYLYGLLNLFSTIVINSIWESTRNPSVVGVIL